MNQTSLHFAHFVIRRISVLLVVTMSAVTLAPLQAHDLLVNKLLARNATAPQNASFGNATAVNDRWIVIGEPKNDDKGSEAGAVHVYSASTQSWVRKLTAPDAVADDRFGESVAIWGDIAAIGAPGGSGAVADSGVAYLFNARTGALLFKLQPPGGSAGGAFGWSVAIFGDRVLVGAPIAMSTGAAWIFSTKTGVALNLFTPPAGKVLDYFGISVALEGGVALIGSANGEGNASKSGVAHLYDANLGTHIHELKANDGAMNDAFGTSVAICDGWLVMGAPQASGPVATSGAVYVFDMISGAEWKKLTPDDAHDSQYFGRSVACSNGVIVIGADGDEELGLSAGAAYCFEPYSGVQRQKLTALDGGQHSFFGNSVSICNGTAVVGSYRDKDQGKYVGSAYVYRTIASPLGFDKVAQGRDFAPGTTAAAFAGLGQPVVDGYGRLAMTATLAGAGVTTANNQGMWDTLSFNGYVDLVMRKGYAWPAGVIANVSEPILNKDGFGIFRALLTGPGVTAANNVVIAANNGTTNYPMLLLGAPIPMFDHARPSRFGQMAQSEVNGQGQVVTLQFAPGTGNPATTASLDSGFIGLVNNGSAFIWVREGETSPVVYDYGQFSRIGYFGSDITFMAGIQSDATSNQGVFSLAMGGSGPHRLVARKGGVAPGTNGAFFGSFSGETSGNLNKVVFRASLTGSGLTTANNIGLWWEHKGGIELAARSGSPVTAGNPLSWGRFIKFWPMWFGGGQVMFLSTLRGAGVNPTNDVALWLLQEDGTMLKLLREGDPVPGTNGATVGTIQNVVADGKSYVVWVTLAGAPAFANQMVLIGHTNSTVATKALRLPHAILRKGALYSGSSTSSRLVSIGVPTRGFDTTGAGMKGIGTPFAEGSLALNLVFADGTRQVVIGQKW